MKNKKYAEKRREYVGGAVNTLLNGLCKTLIEAAEKLHNLCGSWKLEEKAFSDLNDSFAGFEREGTLIKLAAVNGLYSARYRFVLEAEKHVSKFLQSDRYLAVYSGTCTLVEYLSRVPISDKERPPRCWSLISKYLHLFINPRFPMFDVNAKMTVAYHLYGDFKDI